MNQSGNLCIFKRIALIFFFVGCACNAQKVVSKKAMVVSARKEASEIGLQILKQGGTAFDAMIATEFALAVSYPIAGNIGGGGFMVYRTSDGKIGSLDYREKAPIKSHKDMFLDKYGEMTKRSTVGAMAVGVPGTVAGMFAVHKKFGTIPMKKLMQSSINLARKGVVVTKIQAKNLAEARAIIEETSGKTIFSKRFKKGDTIKYLALANTLSTISKKGPSEFYQGKIAKRLAFFIQKHKGILTEEDLKKYEVKWRDPIKFKYKDLDIISMGPPSSGGICLAQIMKMITPYPLSEYGFFSPKTIQVVTEAERRAYADRNTYLGDPDFVKIPEKELLNHDYLKNRMSNFSFEKATPSIEISGGIDNKGSESTETTHYSIVDMYGNAVSATTTINGYYGSKLYCEELGFFLNNQMDDFVSKPGVPNLFGLVGAEANSIAPEKRMLSSMSPTIVEKNNALYMVLGTPGGSRIITSVLQTILNVYEFKMGMQEAVNAHRFHHQWLPDQIYFEPKSLSKKTRKILLSKNYKIVEKAFQIKSSVDAILVHPDKTLEGGADPRGDDTAVGF